MMDLSKLPPVADANLTRNLFRCRPQDRDDAIQEAWVAHLAGNVPSRAVDRFRKRREREYRAGEIRTGSNGVFAYDRTARAFGCDDEDYESYVEYVREHSD